MKKNIKSQKGAISLFVLLSMMFFLAFMLGAFTLVNRRNAAQVEALKETKKIYSNNANAGEKYDAILATNTSAVIPITNIDQLKMVEETYRKNTTTKYYINGKVYTYAKGAIYVLENDIILDLDDTINGKNNLGQELAESATTGNIINDYILYNANYKVNLNGHSIYYQKKSDGSLWKLVCYQNIGTSSSPNYFSSSASNLDYYGKSYYASKFSILDSGISAYSHLWSTDNSKNQNFEFMLMYSEDAGNFNTGKFNRWRQTNNPTKDSTTYSSGSKVEGYYAGFSGASTGLGTENDWGGLTKSTSENAYLDGSIGSTAWNYAVGIKSGFESSYGIKNASTTSKEEILFVRYQ